MGHENKTVKRYRRKLLRLQEENDHLNAVLDIVAAEARKMKERLDTLEVDESIKKLDEPEQEIDNGQD